MANRSKSSGTTRSRTSRSGAKTKSARGATRSATTRSASSKGARSAASGGASTRGPAAPKRKAASKNATPAKKRSASKRSTSKRSTASAASTSSEPRYAPRTKSSVRRGAKERDSMGQLAREQAAELRPVRGDESESQGGSAIVDVASSALEKVKSVASTVAEGAMQGIGKVTSGIRERIG